MTRQRSVVRAILFGLGALALASAACAPAAPAVTSTTSAPAAQAGAPTPPSSKPKEKLSFVYAASSLPSSGAAVWIGKELGYFDEEGIDIEILTAAGGTGQVVQMIAAGQADVGAPSPEAILLPVSKGDNLPLKYFYLWARKTIFDVGLPPASTVKSYADLKGKTIGTDTIGGAMQIFAEAGLREAKVDPAKDVTWLAVGNGAAAAEALKTGKVDAMAQADVRWGLMNSLGYTFDYLPRPALGERLFGSAFVGRDEWIQKNPTLAAKFIRSVTKATIFGIENPDAAIKLHWKMYPESKPRGVDEAEALRQERLIYQARTRNVVFDGPQPHPWGLFSDDSWRAMIEYLGLGDKIKDPTAFYTNDVVKAMGQIDEAKVRERAKTFTVTN